MMKQESIHDFVSGQLSVWALAGDNFKALENVRIREIQVGGLAVILQFNPARMISSAAKLSKEEIARRRCFLCEKNRPAEQSRIDFVSRQGNEYHVLVNPYPIFPEHLVIALARHSDQTVIGRYDDMLHLAKAYPDLTFFYNGPKSGASAPDHHHFQGVPSGLIPLEEDVDRAVHLRELISDGDAGVYHYDRFAKGIFVVRSASEESASRMFHKLIACMDMPEGEPEPLFNLFTYCREGVFTSIVVFRRSHRSHHYFSEGPDHLTMSPGCADMGGVFIVPVEEEYDKMTSGLLTEMVEEITLTAAQEKQIIDRLTRNQPVLEVGIMSAEEIEFDVFSDGKGHRKAVYASGRIEYEGELHDELIFRALPHTSRFAAPSFSLQGVTIGVDFHWQRQETQVFAGDLKIMVDGNRLRAVNMIGVEDYLLSVISSEMSATASEEFLKAHSVISRSWVMARIGAERRVLRPEGIYDLPGLITWLYGTRNVAVYTGDEYMKWYDHDDHRLFDVCADDHCQRYQGLTRAVGDTVRKVIDSTWGQVLVFDGKLCDARFSKCCGGRMEVFSTCWQDMDHPYLQALADTPGHDSGGKCFCNTSDRDILAQVLNNYDQETTDFYEWTEILDPVALGELIERKFGVMTGPVKALVPLERGESGRIFKMRIEGELKTITVGKELEIRRILSETHLKSSAFEVEYIDEEGISVPQSAQWAKIRLAGRGWGHGVGLCQIGAAVMASEGYGYREILAHYYPGAEISDSL